MKIKVRKMPTGVLIPATPEDRELIMAMPSGTWLELDYKTVRNYEFHKRFFALLNIGFEYWTPGGGTVTEREQTYLSGFVRFLGGYTGHYETIDEFAMAYAAQVQKRRADGIEAAKSFEAFRRWATVEAGWYDEVTYPNMVKRREPRSISFARMKQEEFRELYKAVFNVLWNTILQHSFETPEAAENAAYQLMEIGS